MEIRSFLAFELPSDIKRTLARVSDEIRPSIQGMKWVTVENIHLTVVFTGNIRTEEIKAIGEVIQNVCLKYGPFDISLKGMGFFPNRRKPRVLWLGLNGDINRMSLFRDALQNRLKAFGIKEEKRPFKPHLTLGRFRKPGKLDFRFNELMLKYEELTSPVCTVHEFVLFKSDLKPGGAVYTKLKAWPLSGTD